MQKMTKDELERILHSLCQHLGIGQHSPAKVERFLGQVNALEKRERHIQVPSVMRKLEATVGRMREKYPELEPREIRKEDLHRFRLEERMGGVLGKIGEWISELSTDSIKSADSLERHLRTFLSGRKQKRKGQVPENEIEVNEFIISEKCLGGCVQTCAISARASDPQMPWELFVSAIESPNVYINPMKEIWLGDGEVLLYPKLFEAIRMLVVDCGCKVGFTTAGLIPPNRETGIEFFRRLPELGPHTSDVNFCLSFNLFFGCIRNSSDVERYVDYVKETIDCSQEAGAHLRSTILMMHRWNRPETFRAYLKVKDKLEGVYGFLRTETRGHVSKFGDAAESGVGEGYNSPHCPHNAKRLSRAIRPDGSTTISCPGFGRRNSRVGNLTKNSLEQIWGLWGQHDRRFDKEIAQAAGNNCRLHEVWRKNGNGIFTARKSDNPVIKLKRATQAGGMRQGGKAICRK